MVKLLTFLFTTIPALFTAFLAFYARKHTTAVAGLLAFHSILIIFVACLNTIVGYIVSLAWVPAWVMVVIGMFMPGNFGLVLGAIVSAKICRAAYDYGVKKTDLIVKAT